MQSKLNNPEDMTTDRVHKTNTNKAKTQQNTICAGHQYTQGSPTTRPGFLLASGVVFYVLNDFR
jgi:hypothetical protein